MMRLIKRKDLLWDYEEIKFNESQKFLIRSTVNPKAELERITSCIDFAKHQNIILMGIKNFELIKYIEKNMSEYSLLILIEITNSNSVIIGAEVLEFDSMIKDQRIKFLIGAYEEIESRLFTVLRERGILYNMKKTKIISMPYLKAQYPEETNEIFSSIFENLHALARMVGNSVEDVLVGIDNYVNNWPLILGGLHINPFKDLWHKKPCIIVGAGPSLDKNIHLLKEAQKHSLLIAVDAALDTLILHDIVPDIVATVERSEKTFKFYRDYAHFEDVIFLGPSIIRGEILNKFENRIFTGRREDEFYREITTFLGFESLDIGFNVAHVPFAFAQYMDCDPIVLVGLDLAYTGGETHTKVVAHNIEGNNEYLNQDNIVKIKGQNGESLETLNFFMYAKKMFETYMLKDKNRMYINATEGGANILGAQNMRLSEVLESIEGNTYSRKEFLEAYKKIFKEHQFERKILTERAVEFFKEFESKVEGIIRFSNERLVELKEEGVNHKALIYKHSELGLKENQDIQVAFFMLQTIVINYNRKLRSFPDQLDDEGLIQLKEEAKGFYYKIIAVSYKILESIEAYVMVLESLMQPGGLLDDGVNSSN